jgi:haloalkane dehalogenase
MKRQHTSRRGAARRGTIRPKEDLTLTATISKDATSVLGHSMAYVESGAGDPVVFLHGNPTSSYLWRNVVPYLEGLGRCIAPDLIGMGDSDSIADGAYRFTDHRRYLDAFLVERGVSERVTLVLHDWGGALGFDWARRHPSAIKGIAYMETIVRPFALTELPAPVQPVFAALRSPEGESLVFGENAFVEQVLPGAIIRQLGPDELDEYRRPFVDPARRAPTLVWPRELPIDGEPRDAVEIVAEYGAWLAESDVPKLLIKAEPGVLIAGASYEFCRGWPNQTEVTVAGRHFIQEDSPDEIGQAIADWYKRR